MGTTLSSIARDVSANAEVIVGEAELEICLDLEECVTETRAFVWSEARGTRDLARELEQQGVDLGHWQLTAAVDVSADGTVIVGNGVNPAGAPEAWRAVLPDPCSSGREDTDGDGVADVCECSYREGEPMVPDGDANRDGVVDGADYTTWADDFGLPDPTFETGDFNCDGFVDGADYTIWADHFGETFDGGGTGQRAGGATPACGLGAELALLGLLRRRWRGRASARRCLRATRWPAHGAVPGRATRRRA
jgi:hypothetical protein